MNNRIDAIYARQSVDKKDSISIESQIEFCKYELKGGNCKEYTDKGYSGKNTDRPKFQELVRDIKRGLIAKVVVYKLDRISRSILDFANMMELFQQYNVEFVSSTEKFDTSTPMGRAMLNICIVFAQLERETIQKRVTDAYYSRSQRGFKMGGKAPYGFHTEPIKMDGINTKKLVVNPDEAANIRLMFEMYAQPTTSYGDITRYFAEQGILFNGKELIRPTLAQMLRNPVYVQADLDVYEFFKSQGTVIVNDAADFTGMNIIPALLRDGRKMYAYHFNGYWRDVGTIDSLWEANMEVLDPENSGIDIFDKKWKIYSRNPVLPAQKIGPRAVVQDSLITEGCQIYGRVQHSVLSAGVTVEEGATVEDAVLMDGVVVKAGAVVKRCILAEDVVVGAGAKIGGEGPIAHVGTGLTVGAGATVKEGAKVFDSVKEGEEVC